MHVHTKLRTITLFVCCFSNAMSKVIWQGKLLLTEMKNKNYVAIDKATQKRFFVQSRDRIPCSS